MFTTASSLANLNVPRFETRKALIVINLQNDSFCLTDEVFVCKNPDFVEGIKSLIPRFRNAGDVVWVRTEMHPRAEVSTASSDTNEDSVEEGTFDRDERNTSKQGSTIGARKSDQGKSSDEPAALEKPPQKNADDCRRLNHVKSMETRASVQDEVGVQAAGRGILNHNTDLWKERFSKHTTDKPPKFYIAGTLGAEMLDDFKDLVDDESDTTVVKQCFSAFEETSLLMSLRMRLVTELYICGCFTNVGVYATAVDAVQNGFEVTIVEDCVGYRHEDKHIEAMRQMADVLGVDGIESEELILELGGRAPPDADEPMFSGPGLEGIGPRESSLGAGRVYIHNVSTDSHQENRETVKHRRSGKAKSKKPSHTSNREASPSSLSGIAPPSFNTAKVAQDQRGSATSVEQPYQKASVSKVRKHRSAAAATIMEPEDDLGAGDSRILNDVLSSPLSKNAFRLLREEVDWQTMHHRGGEVPRLVAVQGQIGGEGSIPIYRHPADESPPLLPFSPTVENIRREVEQAIKQPLNHALVQLYRGGNDNISEHSDKTLDIVRGSNIINISLGAQRVMTLRAKKVKQGSDSAEPEEERQTQRIPLPHNSAFVLGPESNMRWLHGVRADRRPEKQKSQEERSYEGERISITFRDIGTFMSPEKSKIWGQGARSKSKVAAGDVPRNDPDEMEAMIWAFGKENHQHDFDWDAEYGEGFDVLNLVDDTD